MLAIRSAHAQTFTIVTDSGLDAVRNTMPDTWWLSGLLFVDLDGDGDLDVFMSAHGQPGLAALNDGTGHFTVASGTYPKTEIHIPYDLNEDGRVDLVMTYQDGGGQWWLNQSMPGALNYTAGLTRDSGSSRQQALIDIDRDGKVDWLRGYGAGVLIDLNDGKGGFATVSRTIPNPGTDSISMFPVDIDGDGDEDMVVEWGRYDTEQATPPVFGLTRIYRNDGSGNFTNVTAEAGLTEANLAILGVGDFDQDGDTDLIGLESKKFPHSIFLNDGSGHFVKKDGAVTGAPSGSANYASWGIASMTDFDNDGIADIIVDGRNYLHMLHGTGGGAFTYANLTWGGIVNTAEASVDNGYTFGDIDGDGDLDLIGYKTIDPRYFNLYRNDLPKKNWIKVRPVGLAGNKGAAGAQIKIYEPGTQKLIWYEEVVIVCKQVQQNYYAYSETERHYGLGARNNVDVAVHFYPSNKLVTKNGVGANSTIRISEDGMGTIVPPTMHDAGAGMGAPDGAPGAAGAGGASLTGSGSGGDNTTGSGSGGTGAPGSGGASPNGETSPGLADSGCTCTMRQGDLPRGDWSVLVVAAAALGRRFRGSSVRSARRSSGPGARRTARRQPRCGRRHSQ